MCEGCRAGGEDLDFMMLLERLRHLWNIVKSFGWWFAVVVLVSLAAAESNAAFMVDGSTPGGFFWKKQIGAKSVLD